jgi:hypothetical protein
MNNIETKTAFVRAYITAKNKPRKKSFKETEFDRSRVFAFDTETTIDQFQNLKVGSYSVYNLKNESVEDTGLFYSKECTEKEIKIIKKYAVSHQLDCLTRDDFITKKFYQYTQKQKIPCIGFNLPFDISRIALEATPARGEKFYRGFSFKLAEGGGYSRLRVKSDKTKGTNISFAQLGFKNQPRQFHGTFIDVANLVRVLCNESLSLEKAGEFFDADVKKIKAKEHGKINNKYLDYLLTDVRATISLYKKVLEELKLYNITEPEKIKSQASIGKALLSQMNIKPFFNQNKKFPESHIGCIMEGYYGARSEVRLRKTPALVSYLDFTSLYPSIFILNNLQNFLLAETIETSECTQEAKQIIENSKKHTTLNKKEIWKQMNIVCLIEPENDILPVRTKFKPKDNTKNIALGNIESSPKFWYAISDIIASKILTGKSPKILKAYKYTPKGLQKNLKKINLLGIEIDPNKDNIFEKLLIARLEIKEKIDKLDKKSLEYKRLNANQNRIKLILNSSAYGIFLEINPTHKLTDLIIHSNEKTFEITGFNEKPGKYFNPVIGMIITSTARLLLTIIEDLLKEKKADYCFCDIDSMAFPIKHTEHVQNYFEQIKPFNAKVKLLKTEYTNVWFYGISTKRYCIYKIKNKKYEIIKASAHGLGHLRSPDGKNEEWYKKIWYDIICFHYKKINEDQLIQLYSEYPEISKLSISTPQVLLAVKKINENKPYSQQIKPYGFLTVGVGTKKINGQTIKPIAPFNENTILASEGQFIDANTGEQMQGEYYWNYMDQRIFKYLDTEDGKFNGKIGQLTRKTIKITNKLTIGKEHDEIQEEIEPLKGTYKPNIYYNPQQAKEKILKTTIKEAETKGIPRSTFFRIKNQTRQTNKINTKLKTIQKLLN